MTTQIEISKIKITIYMIGIVLFANFAGSLFSPITSKNDTDSDSASNPNPKSSSGNHLWSFEIDFWNAYQGVEQVAISADGTYIAIGTGYSYLYLFHKSSNVPMWGYQEMFLSNFVSSVSISADGEYITAGFVSGNVYAFHRSSGTPLWSYATGGIITSTKISADGKYIVAGGINNKIYVFNTTNTISPLLWNYTVIGQVHDVAISADGSYFVAGANDVYFFNITGPTPMWTYDTGVVSIIEISSDGNLFIASYGKYISLFNRTSKKPLLNYTCNKGVEGLKLSDDGTFFGAGTRDTIFYFNSSSSSPIWSYFHSIGTVARYCGHYLFPQMDNI
ncbi:hypothetical protein LCGC14_1257290 [marine sediment metagenome]|uniref:Pyrrolo-quinoline quinone repeat domain-containing protein n=1 Tax=marine sediment metagenome TaxID=412755 RepID=A0A0F9L1M2_9ZZZZ|nr:hypothetical protein [bacterium]